MSYVNFNGTVKKANLKPGGDVEIVLIVSGSDLRGKLESLHRMIDCKVDASLDSQVVTYNVQINAKTEKPIVNYRVDEKGVVSEVKPEGEQLTADQALGLRPEKVEIKDKPTEVERYVIDDFILSGLAPSFEELPYDFYSITKRLSEGDTYLKMATEAGMSSGLFVEKVDEYRKRIAPLAQKWDEWRKGKVSSNETTPDKDAKEIGETITPKEVESTSGNSNKDETVIPGWAKNEEITFEDDKSEEGMNGEIDDSTLEEYILNNNPVFEDTKYDFPGILKRKKSGESWVDIARSLKIPSTALNAAWTKYKKLVKERMSDQSGAA
ncbi:hypothetical protein QJ48_04295 [Paenibacillus sp. A3]|uniref:hypothetical protein n=1 Tax=Paenibacillus sp. A3 TaxID=1337054 RepID=UPI0006E4AFEC|nr:hypothetical protein [Paenibacillus sp. A3]KPV60747.1 hypothetical protein QJ48_04295 [Paenibacillus sp. A3]